MKWIVHKHIFNSISVNFLICLKQFLYISHKLKRIRIHFRKGLTYHMYNDFNDGCPSNIQRFQRTARNGGGFLTVSDRPDPLGRLDQVAAASQELPDQLVSLELPGQQVLLGRLDHWCYRSARNNRIRVNKC